MIKTIFISLLLASTLSIHSQNLTTPKGSQKGQVTQTIGLSTVSIVYHSPGVKGREIWGKLVAYDKLWRCGANENTTIEFSHAANVGGVDVPAGIYGLHMIPSKEEWTIILSSNNTSWGSYFYKKTEDVARFKVDAKSVSENVEWLAYGFINKETENATAYLEWEKLRVPFKISFNVKQIVVENMQNELRSLAGFSKTGHLQGAQYCLINNTNLEQGLKWSERAIKVNPGFTSSSTKAGILAQMGKKDEAKAIMDGIINEASEAELNTYGYQLMGTNDLDDAIAIFDKNVKNNPKSWNAYDSLAEAYAKKGDKEKSVKNYKLALKNNPPKNQISRLEGLVK